MNRREFIRRLVVSSSLVVTGVIALYEVIGRGRLDQPEKQVERISSDGQNKTRQSQQVQQAQSSQQKSAQQNSPPVGYVFVAQISSLAGKSSEYFKHPNYGISLLVNTGSEWKAFSATCTHRPYNVEYRDQRTIYCPLHGATFNTVNGAVTRGPARQALPEYGVQVQNGNLFVSTAIIN